MEFHGLDEIQWPALSFGSPDCMVVNRYNSAERLSALRSSSLRSFAALKEHFVIDSTGSRFDLSEPQFVESRSRVQRVVDWLRGSKNRVRWKCVYRDHVDVAELKRLIEEDWRLNETVWQAEEMEVLEDRLAAAGSIAEVIAALG